MILASGGHAALNLRMVKAAMFPSNMGLLSFTWTHPSKSDCSVNLIRFLPLKLGFERKKLMTLIRKLEIMWKGLV